MPTLRPRLQSCTARPLCLHLRLVIIHTPPDSHASSAHARTAPPTRCFRLPSESACTLPPRNPTRTMQLTVQILLNAPIRSRGGSGTATPPAADTANNKMITMTTTPPPHTHAQKRGRHARARKQASKPNDEYVCHTTSTSVGCPRHHTIALSKSSRTPVRRTKEHGWCLEACEDGSGVVHPRTFR